MLPALYKPGAARIGSRTELTLVVHTATRSAVPKPAPRHTGIVLLVVADTFTSARRSCLVVRDLADRASPA